MPKIYWACDHAGLKLKQEMLGQFDQFTNIDLGTHSEQSVDYPDYAYQVADKLKGTSDWGILICGSGIGMSIAANRFRHIRGALCRSEEDAKLSRMHNNANVLCLGARVSNLDLALKIANTFFTTGFEEGRHSLRVQKLC